MKKMLDKGFSAVEGLLLVVLVALIAGVGFFVYRQSQKQDETSKPQLSVQRSASVEHANTSLKILLIPELDVKVDLAGADASKLVYVTSEDKNKVELKLSKDVTTNNNCRVLGMVIVKEPVSEVDVTNVDPRAYKKVGDYYFSTAGSSPYACGDEKLDALRLTYTANNPYDWKYAGL